MTVLYQVTHLLQWTLLAHMPIAFHLQPRPVNLCSLACSTLFPKHDLLKKRKHRIINTLDTSAETIDVLTNTLNNALAELQKWCDRYLVPHPEKCKAMIVQRQSFIDPIQALRLGNIIKWSISERHLGVQVDDKLSWSDHAANVAKSFASKLSLLRRMRFLPRKQQEDLYTKVILPSVTYV